MFQDRQAITGTQVSSSWKMSLSVTESASQTMPCTTTETSCQVRETSEIPCQTDQGSTVQDKIIDETALANFVTEAAIMIEDEIESIVLSRAWEAFHNYGLDNDDDDKEVTLVKTVDIGEGIKVGDLTWTSLDSSVVASVVEGHSDWCEHGARLEVFSVDRAGDLRQEEPRLVVTSPACVTVLQTSIQHPALLAAGCHTGDVIIYRLDREPSEAEIMSSMSQQGDTDNHNPVVAILWLSRSSLLSVHSSGFLRLFSVDMRKYQLELKKTYLVTASHLPRSLKPLRSGEVGLVDGAVSEDDPSNVIVSTEAGCVIMTDLNSELSLSVLETDKTFYDPVMSVYPLHTGTISAMALSPYDDNILATAGEDLRLLLVGVTSPHTPALSFLLDRPVSSLAWSPTRPTILAAATDRAVLLFDTIQMKTGPILKIRHTERNISQPIVVCSFPNKDGSRLVTSDKFGRLYFWRLPQHYNTATIQEKNIFQNIPYHSE